MKPIRNTAKSKTSAVDKQTGRGQFVHDQFVCLSIGHITFILQDVPLRTRPSAALFLLSAYPDVWRRVVWKTSENGFDFQTVDLRGIGDAEYSVYQAAKSIATGSINITFADLAFPDLVSDEAFRLIICALLLARFGDAVLNLEGKSGDIE